MHHIRKTAVATVAALAGLTAFTGFASAASFTVDNFESYSNGQAIATAAGPAGNPDPWIRNGYAVEDNLYATNRSADDGALGAEIPVDLDNPNDLVVYGVTYTAATIERNLGAATNLSAYGVATVLSESLTAANNGTNSNAAIQLVVTDGNSTYLSNAVLPESGVYSSFTFPIDDADMFDADDESTPETLTQVLTDATLIGFRMTSPTGAEALDTLAFDDFTLSTPAAVPEPATASLLLVGVVAAGMRRRRSV